MLKYSQKASDFMHYTLISFNKIPKIGFAHHFYAKNYKCVRKNMENSLEIVYIKKGTLKIKLEGNTMHATPGCVFAFVRTLPFTFETDKDALHTHSTIQLFSNFEYTFAKSEKEIPENFDGIIIPFITEPCHETEIISKKLNSIISDISASRETNDFSSSLTAISILEILSDKFKKSYIKKSTGTSLLCYKTKLYISEHISEKITLSDIARHLNKTSVYLNSVFKNETGLSIGHYINSEKVRLITELMQNKSLPFKNACENVGISDVSYGYRLFKKQLGITPCEYKKSTHFRENL